MRTHTLSKVITAICILGLCWGGAGCRQASQPAAVSPSVVEAINRGVSLMGQYEYSQAVQAFQEALQADPRSVEAKVNLAMAMFNRNRKEDQDLETSQRLLSEVLQQEPHHLRARYFQGIVLQHVGQTEQAASAFAEVLRRVPEDGAAWYLLGLCQQRLGQSGEAELLKAVQYRPRLFSAYYRLFQIAQRDGRTEKAKEYLEQFQKYRQAPLGEAIELPQYGLMGDLALAQPLEASERPAFTRSQYQIGPPRVIYEWPSPAGNSPTPAPLLYPGLAVADLDHDGHLDLVCPTASGPVGGRLVVMRQLADGSFAEANAGPELSTVTNGLSCSTGDYDNDDIVDVYLAGGGQGHLFKGKGDGSFTEVTAAAGMTIASAHPAAAVFLDADHDGDLDLWIGGGIGSETEGAVANALWNNNGDGSFTNIAVASGLACPGEESLLALPGDLDGDRDTDLVILSAKRGPRIFLNELLGQFREAEQPGFDLAGVRDGALQDFDGDGHLDLLALAETPRQLRLFRGDGHGRFATNSVLADIADSVGSWGLLQGLRVVDLDLDGDWDVVCLGSEAHALLNDGRGRFALRAQLWKPRAGEVLAGAECMDVTGDLVPDLIVRVGGVTNRWLLGPGVLDPPSTALAIQLSGIRSRDGRTRSPASAFGVRLTVRAGLREQRRQHTGLAGGANQSAVPVVLGLAGATKADYIALDWPDGVAQVETVLSAGQIHKVAEIQRKVSSCPVLFAWNGQRFEFITDFAGVGGLGYFAAPGVSTPPQVTEHVRIGGDQLQPREGVLDLRVTEPMEESAYLDQLELLAIDHPADRPVFPDERLAISGPLPTHELLAAERICHPVRAVSPAGQDVTADVVSVDRRYAYHPPLDRRYVGFCQPHTLELDFGEQQVAVQATDRVFLFINGFIEYPYSQTVYAASQSRVGWEPIRVDRQERDGQWHMIVPDGGVPGGMARWMTIDLTGQLPPGPCKLRLTTNLELFYDAIFLARHAGHDRLTVRRLPLREASLRRIGFAREYSPDGREPLIYDYQLTDATAPFHMLKGAYTRFGPVEDLLSAFDDRYVIMGPGDEIVLRYDASPLPRLSAGWARTYVLISQAYCKDMDFYTATPRTLEPLPYRGMTQYPYPKSERYPMTPELEKYHQTYNTRLEE